MPFPRSTPSNHPLSPKTSASKAGPPRAAHRDEVQFVHSALDDLVREKSRLSDELSGQRMLVWDGIAAKLLAGRRLHIELTEQAKELLADEGYDPAYGARPLKRVIQRRVQDPLALSLLRGEIHEGDRVRVDARDGALVFEPVAMGAEAA